jgi:hypothetical protein
MLRVQIHRQAGPPRRSYYRNGDLILFRRLLFATYFNFVRIRQALRTTPAMAAGVTSRLWCVANRDSQKMGRRQSLDLIGLKEWIAAHCGLNPHAAGTLDPDAKLIAERDKLRASLAAMRDKADRLAALLAASETRSGELTAELAAVKKSGKRPSNGGLSHSNADTTPQKPRASKTKPDRKAYMRELMRKKRAGKRQQAAPADTADKAATPAADTAPSG